MKSFLGFKKVFNFQAELKKTKYYKNQIARINLKHGKEFTSKTYWQDGVFLSNVAFNSDNFSKSISKTIATGKYEFAPGELRTIEVQKKKRVLYTFRLTDLIMHGVVSQILLEAMEDDFSDSLYSYRAKIDRWQALGDIADFIRRQKKRYADPKRRGVYVIRRDVTKYTDRIPLGSDSPLWKMLEDLLDPERKIMKEEHWDIIRNVIRPEVHTGDNNLFCNTMGVPTGSPISTVLFNFYLLPLDRALTNIPGAFYARYSDDFIFMHESYLVMQEANKIITDILGSLKLATNPLKDQLIYYNGAGRRSEEAPELPGGQSVSFLGCRVSFDGTISLSPNKIQDFFSDLKNRVDRTTEIYETDDLEKLGKTVCNVMNQTLDPEETLSHHGAGFLLKAITDRNQLKEIDYRLAKFIAERLSKTKGPKAFRTIPYQKIRDDWKLKSLYHTRNR